MSRFTRSTQIYFAAVIATAILTGVASLLPQGTPDVSEQATMSAAVIALANGGIVLLVYGGLGWLGLTLWRRLGYPDVWDPMVSTRERLVPPALAGLWIGLAFIVADNIFSRYHGLGPLPHPPFPTSLVVSFQAGLGEEMIFRLFFIPVLVWFISHVALKGKQQNTVFWVAAIFSGMFFAAGHIPTVMILLGTSSFSSIPTAMLVEIFLLNGTLSLIAAFFFKRSGYLAAVTVHTTTDLVWHVIWGLMR
jgi:hypothetical protein